MRAVGYRRPLPIEDPEALIDATLPDPAPTGRDLLVEVRAVSVWYAGSIARAGTDSELHLVDERIVGHMPASLDFARAAAVPLTSITAWELLFDRLQVAPRADADGREPAHHRGVRRRRLGAHPARVPPDRARRDRDGVAPGDGGVGP